MNYRVLTTLSHTIIGLLIAPTLIAQSSDIPRTEYGDPDFQGTIARLRYYEEEVRPFGPPPCAILSWDEDFLPEKLHELCTLVPTVC